jgi:hypothetical protein
MGKSTRVKNPRRIKTSERFSSGRRVRRLDKISKCKKCKKLSLLRSDWLVCLYTMMVVGLLKGVCNLAKNNRTFKSSYILI